METITFKHRKHNKKETFELDSVKLWLPRAYYNFENSYQFSLDEKGWIDVTNPQYNKTIKTKITTLKQWINVVEKELNINIDRFDLIPYSVIDYEKNYRKKDLEN